MYVAEKHFILGTNMKPPWESSMQIACFGMGCFWGAERKFWQTRNVYSTQVGYSAGVTKNPSYEKICLGNTGHTEVVQVIFDPKKVAYWDLLTIFWENHNPTQGMAQGNDIGTQYRSAIYTTNQSQYQWAIQSKNNYQDALTKAGYPKITTEILPAEAFYYAEDYHQQYLGKNPNGYCAIGGVGIQLLN